MRAFFVAQGLPLVPAGIREVTTRVAAPGADLAQAWETLCRRAAPNVFMHPAMLDAAHAHGLGRIHVLQGWLRDAHPPRLVGLWALRQLQLAAVGPRVLASPPHDHAFVGNPVVDPEFMDETLKSFLDTIEHDPGLTKLLTLRQLDASAPTYAPLLAQLEQRGRVTVTGERECAFASRELGPKPAGSTRRKLRQKWNRLAAQGQVQLVNERSPGAVREAFETFLALERASWKGARGSALLNEPAQAAFARRFMEALAAQRSASVAVLALDGRPIATQVLLYRGAMAYTWKTAFDARYGDFSPGMLLVDKVTQQLFAAGEVDAIESCSPEGGFMSSVWHGRRPTVDVVAAIGRDNVPAYAAAALGARGGAWLRGVRQRLRDRLPFHIALRRS